LKLAIIQHCQTSRHIGAYALEIIP